MAATPKLDAPMPEQATPDKYAELERLARAATPGPWEWVAIDKSVVALGTKGDVEGAGHVLWSEICAACQRRGSFCTSPSPSDADYIAAANPAAVLDLIAELRAKDAELAEKDAEIERLRGALGEIDRTQATVLFANEAEGALVRIEEIVRAELDRLPAATAK